MRQRSKIAKFLSVVLLVFSLAGCGSEAPEESKGTEPSEVTEEQSGENSGSDETVVVRIADFARTFPFQIARARNLLEEEFKDENIVIEYTDTLSTGAAVSEAFGANAVDIGILGDMPALAGISSGYGFKIIGKNYESALSYPLLVAADSDIQTIADLKGRKVATSIGTSAHYALLRYLETAGLTVDDIEFVNAADTSTLLRTGEIDAICSHVTIAPTLVNEGTARILTDGSAEKINTFGMIAGKTEFIEKYPDITARILKVVNEGFAWAAENPDEANQIVADFGQADVQIVKGLHDVISLDVHITEENITSLDDILSFLKEQNALANTDLKIEDAVDLSYLEAAGLQ